MRILYVTTISNTVNAFLIPHIKMLIDKGHHVDVAFNIGQEVDAEIFNMGCNVHIIPFSRTPLNNNNFKAYKLLKQIISKERYDVVHVHTPVASVCVRLACMKIDDVKVIYTAHGFHFFKGAPIINWILYYPVERLLARYTDIIITINKEDYKRAKKSFKARRIEYVPGVGLDTKKINEIIIDKFEKRKEFEIPDEAFVLVSVGEINKNKNHEVIIRSIDKLNNPIIHYLICGEGELENHLNNLIYSLNLENQVHLLGFRSDVPDILKISDVFVFPSLREGLGLAALEGMASSLPIITSNIHGILDYSVDEKTGYICKPKDINKFAKSIKKLNSNPKMRKSIGIYNKNIIKKFEIQNVLKEMELIYNSILD